MKPSTPIEKSTNIVLDQNYSGDGEALLRCPCGDIYLHHYHVTLYDRVREDQETHRTEIGEYVDEDDGVALSNPSSRRCAIGIRFWCEACGECRELSVAQHKGLTFLKWRPISSVPARARVPVSPPLFFGAQQRVLLG